MDPVLAGSGAHALSMVSQGTKAVPRGLKMGTGYRIQFFRLCPTQGHLVEGVGLGVKCI